LSWARDRYVAFQFVSQSGDHDAGGVRVLDTSSAATAALMASRLIISNEGKLAGGISGVFNPVIMPDGSKILAAAWTGFNVAELAEFSARTGRLLAVLIPAASMPGYGSPCQVLWIDPSGAHLIAYCGTAGVVNGTRFTPVNLHLPDTFGTAFTGILW
jgi:ammonia channel protein AmtB